MLSRARVSHHIRGALPVALCTTISVLLLAFLAVLTLGASVAQAEPTHLYTGTSFGPDGVGSSRFDAVVGMTVQQSTGDVLVLDSGADGRLYKFDATGKPVDFSSAGSNEIAGTGVGFAYETQIAVDESGGPDRGDIYIADSRGVRIYSEGGTFLGELSGGAMCGVAVDSSGNVYVGIQNQGAVRRYAPSTNPVTNTDETGSIVGLGSICSVAADAAGDVYVDAPFGDQAKKYEALQFGSLSPSGELFDEYGRVLTIDPVSGEVFVYEGSEIAQYDGSSKPPELISRFSGATSQIPAVGVDHASGDVYAPVGGTIGIFGPLVTLPDVSTEEASNVTLTEATLQGTVEPVDTEVTSCVFKYGPSGESTLGHSVPCEPTTPYTGNAPVAVTAQITGLSTGTRYTYELVVDSANGQARGKSAYFRTKGPGVLYETDNSLGLRSTKATMDAEIYPGGEATSYHLEYGTSSSYGSSTEDVELEAGEEPVDVEVPIAGLQPDTTYHFRFIASTAAATATGADVEFTTPAVVTNETLTGVGASSAGMSADIAPGGEPASYELEYGTSTAYGSRTPTIGLGGGEDPVAVISHISELQPGTTYHFRFVAIKDGGNVAGPDLQFTTHNLTAAGLPDGRGYEEVTPVDNEGAEPYVSKYQGYTEGGGGISTAFPMAAAADGNAVSYVGSPTSSGNGKEGNGEGNQFYAHRNSGGGWTQTNIQPTGFETPVYFAFSPNLDYAVLDSSEALSSEAPAKYDDLYVRDNASGSYRPLSTVTPPNRSAGAFGALFSNSAANGAAFGEHFAGASADYTHLFFEANDALASGAVDPTAGANNLYESFDGLLRTVNVLPDGSAAPSASIGSEFDSEVDFSHAISTDGSRVFWTSMKTGSLYVREDGEQTKLIAEGATFQTASANGAKVLYTKAGDLYEENLESTITRDLAPGAETLGLAGAGEDLEYVYLVGNGVLATGAIAGKSNLYLLHGGQIELIAVLGEENGLFGEYPWQANIGRRTAEATPSGHGLVFMSEQSLTGYDNVFPTSGRKALEAYVYDAVSGKLTCASCDSSGAPPVEGETTGFLPTSGYPTYQLRLISEDGSRVFFESAQPLLPQAQDGKMNVYEWERDGSGSCAYADGCVYLLSTGTSAQGSYFVDASANGDDVFVETTSQLVPADQNEYFDIYDARVGAKEATAPIQCTGTGCQGVAASPPIFATPASVTYDGVGNFAPSATPVTKPKSKPKSKASCTKSLEKAKKSKSKKSATQAKTKAKPKSTVCKAKKAAAKRARRGKNGRSGR
jgi:hypothetical protein